MSQSKGNNEVRSDEANPSINPINNLTADDVNCAICPENLKFSPCLNSSKSPVKKFPSKEVFFENSPFANKKLPDQPDVRSKSVTPSKLVRPTQLLFQTIDSNSNMFSIDRMFQNNQQVIRAFSFSSIILTIRTPMNSPFNISNMPKEWKNWRETLETLQNFPNFHLSQPNLSDLSRPSKKHHIQLGPTVLFQVF